MDTNYRIAYDKGWRDLKGKVPETVARIMNVSYSGSNQQFIVPFLNENYIVDWSNEKIWRESDGHVPAIEAAILILHYLSFFRIQAETANTWVSLKEIPNGGSLFYPAFHREAIGGLIKAFGQRPARLLECAKLLGGQSTATGNASVTIKAFPKIPLRIIVWEGDEEIPPNATILFDPSIEHFLHIESIIGLGWFTAAKLIRLASSEIQVQAD